MWSAMNTVGWRPSTSLRRLLVVLIAVLTCEVGIVGLVVVPAAEDQADLSTAKDALGGPANLTKIREAGNEPSCA